MLTTFLWSSLRPFAVVLAALCLSACATTQGPRPQGGMPGLAAQADDGRPPPPGVSRQTMYDVLVAEIAGHRGDVATALDRYMALARRLDDPQVAERAARIAVFARDNDLALQAAERWLALDPASLDARQVIAAMKIRSGDVEGALAQLDAVLSSDQADSGQKLRMIAGFLSREQDKAAALSVMQRLVERRSQDLDAWTAYALLAIRAEDADKARDAIGRLAQSGPVNIGVAGTWVGLLQKRGEQDQALRWLEERLAAQPAQLDLRLMYARVLADAKRYDEARAEFERVAAVAPDNADVQYALGLLYLQANKLDDAKQRFEGLVERNQRVDESAYYLAQIAEVRKDDAGALDWYGKVGPDSDNWFESQLRTAFVYARTARPEDADRVLRELAPETPEQEIRRVRVQGEILTDRGRLDEAMSLYDDALAKGFDSGLLYVRAMLGERMNRLDVLERDLRAILEKEPDNAQALNALGYTLADRTERYDEAYKYIARALEISPDDFYILDSMGWVLYRLGRLAEAVEYLRKARALRDDPEVAAHLAEVLWVAGDRQGAREVWEAALKNTPGDQTLLETIKRLQPN